MNASGTVLSCRRPAINFLSYWDGDLEREILDGYTDSPATITKMNEKGTLDTILSTDGYYTCNTTKGTPCLSADIFGDWREELIVRAADAKSIRIFCTPYETQYRVTTLMHDPQYRTQVSAQNTAYNQPPHPSFYLGSDQPLPARPDVVVNGGNATRKTGASVNTSEKYMIRNVNSGLYLAAEGNATANGTNVLQTEKANATVWQVEEAGSGYYFIHSTEGSGAAYLDVPYGKADNGTSIDLWTNDNSDARMLKFVDNGDGSYLITTKVSDDASGLGITSGSKESGADVIEWELDGTANQQWVLEVVIDPINGKLVQNLLVYDRDHAASWSIDDSLASGDLVFGDRDVTYISVPDALAGAEEIVTSCDGKTVTGTQATFEGSKDIIVSVALDTRVVDVQNAFPAWLADWTKTDMTLANDKDVSFYVYQKEFAAGETVTLGDNGTSTSVVNYTVFVQENGSVPQTSEPETTTTQPSVITAMRGDVDVNGDVNVADAVLLARFCAEDNEVTVSAQGKINAEVTDDTNINTDDLTKLMEYLAGIIETL